MAEHTVAEPTQAVNEEWRPAPNGWGDRYEVSNLGRVRTTSNGHILSYNIYRNGYAIVRPYRGNKGHNQRVHRWVAQVFLGDPPEGAPEVNHRDGNKLNNSVSNLEWVSRRGNIKHFLRGAPYRIFSSNKPTGSRIGTAKLDEAKVSEILRLGASGNTSKHIARVFGVSCRAISDILHGHSWQHVPGTRSLHRDQATRDAMISSLMDDIASMIAICQQGINEADCNSACQIAVKKGQYALSAIVTAHIPPVKAERVEGTVANGRG